MTNVTSAIVVGSHDQTYVGADVTLGENPKEMSGPLQCATERTTVSAVRGPLPIAFLLFIAGCGDNLGSGGRDPFEPQPDQSEGLTNLSADLDRLLEGGDLVGACSRYFAGEAEGRRARLLCGKEMFFYESFDTVGAPAPLIDHLVQSFPDEDGAGFE